MKRYMWVIPVVALVVFASFAVSRHASLAKGQGKQAPPALNGEASPLISLANATRGVVFKTAAINFDGSRASCFGCTNSIHLATGAYEVDFNQNVQANNGWSRFLQVDTLTTGSINDTACSTADRAGNVNGVFVLCYDGAGSQVDSSFFLFVAR